ncbi:uncharacterized protein LOC111696819 [Eurytemora carolleeae]|uniref:uncharacterized protein LOC111696819 n=1 Tax=Eurytemora carolleeae TaxID=1294199 RepID=UPI000C776981|nr:uncharacterized protein LOC111696819 [Eurytemora carolleeae]|eukprot:XP_023322335.1 uncharacterized protein LOC111696819 [Eurytemora affinis]
MWGKRVQSLEELSNQKVEKDFEDSNRILVKRDNEFILGDNAEHKDLVETEKTPKNKDNFGVKRGLTYHWYKPFIGYKIRKFIPAGSPKEKRSRTWLQLRGMWGKRSGNQLQDDQEQKRRHEHITYSQIQNFGIVFKSKILQL